MMLLSKILIVLLDQNLFQICNRDSICTHLWMAISIHAGGAVAEWTTDHPAEESLHSVWSIIFAVNYSSWFKHLWCINTNQEFHTCVDFSNVSIHLIWSLPDVMFIWDVVFGDRDVLLGFSCWHLAGPEMCCC